MVHTRRYLVLVIFFNACFTQAYCKLEASDSDHDTPYFRGNKKAEVDAESNFREDQKTGRAKETNGLVDQKTTDGASETHICADIEEYDVKNSIFKNTKSAGIGSIDVRKPSNSLLRIPWWPSFLSGLVNRFHHQRIHNGSQFNVLYMGRTYIPTLNYFPLKLLPSNQAGIPVINSQKRLSPPSRRKYVNYVAARPEIVPRQINMKNAELTILREMNSLWKYYTNRFSKPPNIIVLYSWIMPCPKCTDLIIKHFNQAHFSNVTYKVVAYTTEGTNSGLTYMTPEGNRNSRQRLNENDITYWKQQCKRPENFKQHGVDETTTSSDNHVCKLSDTFQGCFVECLGHGFCSSCKESRKMPMNVAMVNDLVKQCAQFDIKTCASVWVHKAFSELRIGASPCTNIDSPPTKILSCAVTCVGRPLSKPLDPFKPLYNPGYLIKFSDIANYAPVTFADFCSDIRADGYLCFNYSTNSFTAGNSLCRKDSVCNYYGYEFKWCFTEYGGWGYCCTTACSYDKYSFMWCHSGPKHSQLCGSPGYITVNGRLCLEGYPCGMHQDQDKEGYNYWCYTDTDKNWDYCCQPGDTCSTKGEYYNWCYTGYKKKTGKQKCTCNG